MTCVNTSWCITITNDYIPLWVTKLQWNLKSLFDQCPILLDHNTRRLWAVRVSWAEGARVYSEYQLSDGTGGSQTSSLLGARREWDGAASGFEVTVERRADRVRQPWRRSDGSQCGGVGCAIPAGGGSSCRRAKSCAASGVRVK